MFLSRFLVASLITSLLVPLAFASAEPEEDCSEFSNFQSVYEIEVPEIELASEVKVYTPEVQSLGVALIENESGQAQATASIKETKSSSVSLEISETSALNGNADYLVDGSYSTATEFDLDEDGGLAYLILEGEEITSSKFSLSLDSHVALPYGIEIMAYENGEWSTVLAYKQMSSTNVSFPETTADKWKVSFWHSQPLRVRELGFTDSNASTVTTGEYIVWLARPGETYTLYADAAVYTKVSTTEAGDLLDDEDSILEAELGDKKDNPYFTEPDDDEDGIPNYLDNCVSTSNADQEDLDENGLGDACEDHDGDGVVDSEDNCPEHANKRQKDEDGDGVGDECDGEESRLTEKLPWLPWLAMGIAGLVIFGIILHTIKNEKN